MSRKGWIGLAVAAVVVVLACVAGGFVLVRAIADAADNLPTPSPRPSASSSTTTTDPGHELPQGPQAPAQVKPGAPYAYRIPVGWVKAVSEGGPRWMTSVGPPLGQGKTSIVAVAVAVDGSRELEMFEALSSANVKLPPNSYLKETTLAGRPALRFEADQAPGGSFTFVTLADGRVLYLLCQWVKAQDRAEAEQGCASVAASLEITAA